MTLRAALLLLLAACPAASCATTAQAGACACAEEGQAVAPAGAQATGGKTLYERLGGLPAITAVVDTFLQNVAADPRVNHRFAASDLAALRGHLVDQVCQASGGPCVYRGRDMRAAHEGMRVADADFDAVVEDLAAALDAHGVPAQEKGELLAALAALRPEIVGR